ncbi:oxygen-independent coproporphyrinogen III oxidase [Roseibium algae]|uniref:Coproporphyrinogen-III oxidase n=1 Tax=Roseibium algae TaxID=3123038 RepID=A0ABU8TI69_9HYPH
MTEAPLSYAMRNVPRYTSYPTAPHFHGGITSDTYAQWLAKLSPEDSLSLYLHVPFCRDICHYCGCHTKATRQDGPLLAYGITLEQELELVSGHIKNSGPVRHIHWGGGTPSLLPEESLLNLANSIRSLFDSEPDIEHAIELDPRFVTSSLAETLARMGVNRTSLGVQDFDPAVQKAIGRIQSYELVRIAVENLRSAGLNALNFDLMYGLPGQTPETIQETVARSIALQPSRIALFGYAHVPWMKKHQRLIDESLLPGTSERLELAETARSALQAAGYVAIGLDHFARPDDSMAIAEKSGDLKRNFQGYTTDRGDSLIGLGVSSIGKLQQGYVQNISDVGNWRRAISENNLPTARGIAFSMNDRLRGQIIERLMTDHACDLSKVCAQFSEAPQALMTSIDTLKPLIEDKLVRVDEWKVTVLAKGRPYVRLIAAAFDAYLPGAEAGAKRHSMAV